MSITSDFWKAMNQSGTKVSGGSNQKSSSSGGSSKKISGGSAIAPTSTKKKKKKSISEEFWEVMGDDDIAPVSSVADRVQARANGDSTLPLRRDLAPIASLNGSKKDKDEEEKDNKQKWYQGWFDKGALKDGYDPGDISKAILGTLADVGQDALTGIVGMGESAVDALMTIAPYALLSNDPYMTPAMREQQNQIFAQAKKDSAEFVKKDLYDEQSVANQLLANAYGGLANMQKQQNGGFLTAEDWANASEQSGYAKQYIENQMEAESVLGEKSDALVQSAGVLAAQYGLTAMGVPWYLTSGVTSFGSEAENALKQGATNEEAISSAAITAGAEILTEKMFGGDIFTKNGADLASKYLSRAVSNKVLRNLLKAGYDVGGEALEEGASQFISRFGSSLYKEENLGEILFSEEALDEYIESMIGGGVLGGAMTGINVAQSNAAGVDYTTGLTENEQKVVDKLYKEWQTEDMDSQEKKKLYDDILRGMDRGTIDADTISEILDSDSHKAYDSLTKESEEFKTLYKTPFEKLSAEQNARLKELQTKHETKAYEKALEEARNKRFTDTWDLVRGTRLEESFREKLRMNEDFKADFDRFKGSKHEEAARKTLQSAIDFVSKEGKKLNNTNAMHDVIDLAANIASETGKVFYVKDGETIKQDFIKRQTEEISKLENLKKRTAEQDKILAKMKDILANVESGKTKVNGDITADGITLNLDSENPLIFTTGHEVTHGLEKAKSYDKLRDALFSYAKAKNVDIDAELTDRKARYAGIKNADPEKELVADLVGDYVFNDHDFIHNLSTEHRNVFQKVYDEIKHLCKLATAGSKAARDLERVKRQFEKAFREANEASKAKTDAKYSLSDSDGKQLTKAQQDYFKDSKVRDEDGNLKVMYHGTPNGDFAVFKDGTYFTDNKEYADTYQNPGASSISTGKTASNPRTFEVYLDIKKPFDITDPEARSIYINDYIKGGNAMGINPYLSDAEYDKINTIDWTEGEDLREFLIDNGYDYDGLVLDEGATGGYGDEVKSRGKSYVVFSPEQVKNVDNQSPTSDPDIRFSLSESVEETKDLIAVHNLTSDKLLKSLKMGGLPMPSIAITKEAHDNFGNISLIFRKDTIDPKASKANKVYSGDAWTPTYPTIDYEASEEAAARISGKVKELSAQLPDYYQRSIRSMSDYTNIDDNLNRWGGEQGIIEKFGNDYGMKQLYLAEKGDVVPVEMKRTEKHMTDTQKELYQSVVDGIGIDVLKSFNEKGDYEKLGLARMAWLEQHGDALKEIFAENWAIDGTLTKAEALEIANEQTKLYWRDEIRRALAYAENGGVTVSEYEDISGTNAKIDEKIADSDYEQWLSNLFSGIEGKSGIRNQKDTFTPSGNRRSFDALHYVHNLENVIKAMKESGTQGIGHFGGGNIFGASATEYKSIKDIKADSDRLQNMSDEEYQALKDGFAEQFRELAASLPKNKNSWTATDDAADMLVEAVVKCKTRSSMASYLKKECEGWANYSDSVVDGLIELVNDIRSMPTGYFEAKPQRAVGFDEVAAVVIPYNADAKLKQELLNNGFSIAEYDPKVEGDRQRVVNQFEDLKFSLSDAGKPFKRSINDVYGKDVIKQNPFPEIAPIVDPNATQQQETQLTEDNATVTPAEMAEMFPDDVAPLFDTNGKKGVPDGQQAFIPDAGVDKKITRKELHQNILDNIKARFKSRGFDFDKVLKNAKDLSTWSTVDNTPQRVMEKALGYKEGGILADITVNQVAQNESEGIKWINKNVELLKQISKDYNIKPGSKESAAAQMYAEGFYVDENNNIVSYGDRELAIDFPDPKVRANIKGLARDTRIRHIYNEALGMINESRTRNAYPEIPKLDNYFLHFRAMEDTFSRLGLPFNPNDIRAKDLPTDLNGVTADLKPGQPYFASAMHRKGKRTSFDMLGGIERYLSSAKNQIYHIDDIQTLRALRNYIAETYGQATGLEDIDSMSDTEAEERIKQVYGSHLSTFAKFLNEEANVLAGKTALIDRGIEGIIGRRGITFLNTLNKQVGSNMVGYNVSSSLTNFLPVAQTFAKTNKFDFTKAFAQTVANKVSGGRFDSFAEDSPVVIRRKGEERFYRTPWQKIADPGYALMSAVDDISTELIARTKYNELTRKGMDSQKAHFETDKWVSRLMGDRSLGQQPQLYNSKMLGLVTKFQLEVRNQLDSQFYDTIQETKVSNEDIENGLLRNAKTAAKVASTFTQLAVVQHLFGKAFESVAGYNPAFDIIEVLMTAFGYDDEEESEDTALDNIEQGFLALLEDLPYASTFTGGGRIPISSALPVQELIKGEDKYGNDKSRWETLSEIAPYYLLPGGYGQVKKTAQGLGMFSDEHPIAGSYTDSGNLRFPVEDTLGNKIKAGIFGQYASENARKYFDQEQRTLNPEQTEIFAGLDIPIEEYWEYRDNLYEFYEVKDQLKDVAFADDATDEDVLRYAYINNVYSNIYDLYDKQKELASGNSDNKQSEMRKLQSQMQNMLSDSKYAVDRVSITGAYGEVGGRRYNKDTESGKWYEIKPKNADGTDNWYYQKEQEVTKALGISYSEYWNNREEYNYAYDKPDQYAVSQACGGYESYRQYTSELWDIKADKDKNGKSINGSRKAKVIDYLNELDADYYTKIILFKNEYNADDTYNQEIIDYLNGRDDISYSEMEMILKHLGFDVDSQGNISW